MRTHAILLFIVLYEETHYRVFADYFSYHSGIEYADQFSNEWVVRISGGQQVAELVALQQGYIFLEQLTGFEDTYIFIKNNHELSKKKFQRAFKGNLSENPKVQWAEQLFSKKRQKRDFIYAVKDNPVSRMSVAKNVSFNKGLDPVEIAHVAEKDAISEKTRQLLRTKRENILETKREDLVPSKKENPWFNDELWNQEWYLQDTRTRDDLPKLDLNVLPVYKMGITGKGIKVTILDDGIEYTHDDLKDNYEPSISWDAIQNDSDPKPTYDISHKNGHGTRCAGEVAMVANNGKCGVGVAYEAKIGGIRLIDDIINDKIEGTALGYGFDRVDIYSASWGPIDDGKTVDGPGRLAQEAFERGITKGRNGKGTIYVWANGNGGSRYDNCNCDGYIGSIYTVAIGSASQRGAFPWYGEQCASTLAVTYSSGAYEDQMITTTDLNNECTIKHTGTSASAPLAAGIIALALQANPNLTWRDIQHLIVWTSEYAPLADNHGWITNGAGFRFDARFGFGLMNAHSLVVAAQTFKTVPEKAMCVIPAYENINTTISYKQVYTTNFYSDACFNTPNEVNYLEHIELKVNILYTVRGALQIRLVSPKGTKVSLLLPRKLDKSRKGFVNWRFMSVATWGEPANGTWTLEVFDMIGPEGNIGLIGPLTLIFHGTKERPDYMNNGPREYNENYPNFNEIFDDNYENDIPSVDKINNHETENSNEVVNENNENYLTALWRKFYPSILVEEPIFDTNNEEKLLERVHHRNNKLNRRAFNFNALLKSVFNWN